MKRIIIIICILFLSCTKQNKFEKNLTSESNNHFWIRKVIDEKGNYRYINSQIVFFEDYKMMSFNSFDENKLGNRSMINIEGSNEENWSYNKKDSTFQICAVCIYKVTKFSRDTIFMKGKGYGGDFILIKHKGKYLEINE